MCRQQNLRFFENLRFYIHYTSPIVLPSLIAGLTFGLSAGLSPGPLSTFVISQTLRHGIREGVRVALSPLITDLPIILISVFVLTQLANANAILGVISIIGGLFVLTLAYETFTTTHFAVNEQAPAPQSLLRGALVNALSPHPYLFWFSVGAPTMVRAMQDNGWPAALAFVLGFYLLLIGSKVGVAVLVGRSRGWLMGPAYAWIMRALGVLLLVFALLLFREALHLFGYLA
jgi:threonine/homoserine/homoserine lactone efflux protein